MPTTIARARVRPGVRPDQVWRDVRPLAYGRFLRVLRIHEWADEVEVVQVAYNPRSGTYVDLRGARPKRVRRDRFVPGRGYELARDAA